MWVSDPDLSTVLSYFVSRPRKQVVAFICPGWDVKEWHVLYDCEESLWGGGKG